MMIIMSVPGHADDFQDGIAAYEKGDYKRAYGKFWPFAKGGNADAQNHLGKIFTKRWREGPSYLKAFMWFNLAAKQGHANALNNLVQIYGKTEDGRRGVCSGTLVK